jgi:hypothetical protein
LKTVFTPPPPPPLLSPPLTPSLALYSVHT